MTSANVLPLAGIKVLDFSTLLPGPLAGLMLAEAGADVVKFEKPASGDAMRDHEADFALLNRGKTSISGDLKAPEVVRAVLELIKDIDVLIEQFRPGVMERLGLGEKVARAANPRLIYCSVNGYGSTGSKAHASGHDLTYVADAGLLSLSAGADGAPVMPTTLLADIGGGAYPAFINILLALMARQKTGLGTRLEIAMAQNTLPFLYPAHASAFGRQHWPGANDSVETGVSPRYNLYRASDGRYIAAAPVEEKFWNAFCEMIDLPEELRHAASDRAATREAVARRIAGRSSSEWSTLFASRDVACTVVKTFEEAMTALGEANHVPRRTVSFQGLDIEALPLPIVEQFRRPDTSLSAPELGQALVTEAQWA